MLKVGLTGGIGSGKTAVSDLFHKLGAHIIDTDAIAHQLVNNNLSVREEIVSAIGPAVIDETGKIDRKKLAQIVFNSKGDKNKLETILHPKIRDEVNRQILSLNSYSTPPPYIIIVIPLLLETDFRELVDRILVVISDEKIRIQRVRQRDNRSVDEIRAIIASQVNDEQRLSAADDILENNQDFSELESGVQRLHEQYISLSPAYR